MYIIDFDDTLFDTHAFKQARCEALNKVGVSKEVYNETYAQAYQDRGKNIYSNNTHASALEQKGFSKNIMLQALRTTTGADIKKFLFASAVEFLDYLKNKGERVILLSLGEASWQDLKVTGCGIESYFNQIFYVNDSKEHVLAKFKKEELASSLLINDKVGESKKLQETFPEIEVILKKSPAFTEKEYQESLLKCFDSFKEIKDYVDSKLG